VKRHALQNLTAELKKSNVDCALVTETWFTNRHLDQYFTIAGYKLFRRDRQSRSGGGVCFYIRNDIDCSVVSFCNEPTLFEKLWIRFKYCTNVYYIACCYHPPAPRYQPADLIAELTKDIDAIVQQKDCSPIIIVAGDFNGLKTDFLQEYCGLSLIVHDITHGKKVLDKVFINRPELFSSIVFRSLLKTKHMAILVSADACHAARIMSERKHVKVYDVRAPSIDSLRAAIANDEWREVYESTDVSDMYGMFLSKCKAIIDCCVPVKTISLGPRDPVFMTPLIKQLLKGRNKLRRSGKIEQANVLAEKINRLIAQERSRTLSRLDTAGPKKLWDAVRATDGSCNKLEYHSLLEDRDAVNNFFANISYEHNYIRVLPWQRKQRDVDNAGVVVEAFEIERCLKSIKPTATGPDGVPRWFFHNCSVELADVIAHIISQSLERGIVPSQWKVAHVTPVQKTNNPKSLADFRPISVTSILSRMTEKIVVRKWLMPAIPDCYIDDQFGFRPTGSTTCALVYMMHHVTKMLETNAYVRCLCVDFSKAFDVVDHNILSDKLSRLSLPSSIFCWLLSFLSGRTQHVKVGSVLSGAKPINRGTIQGSGIGPTDYLVMASDLRALSRLINKLFKYADDTTLLVPEYTDVPLEDEFAALRHWATINKMILNMLKTKEIVFHRPDPCLFVPPVPLADIERVNSIKLLGLFISETLDFDEHVKYLLTVCGQRCYLLKALRWQGLSHKHIGTVFQSLILSRLTYALSAWGGFLTKQQISKIDAFLARSHRFGYTLDSTSFCELIKAVDSQLFTRIKDVKHCINSLLPPVRKVPMDIRSQCYELPNYRYKMFKDSFIIRTVYRQSY